jgi:Fe-S-cluster-containing dehydrogenase component
LVRYGIVIDASRCNGCYNCFIACKDEFCGNDYPPYSISQPATGQFWMKILEKERGQYPKVKVAYTAIPCMHCENASCIKAATDGQIYRRPDGIVIIDPEKARGQKELLNSCPYRVIYWNEARQVAQKCTMCAHLLDRGYKEPRCVESCPTGALTFGDLNDPGSAVSRLMASGQAVPLHPEYGLKEKVNYLGLPAKFVAGSVVFKDTDQCASGVSVSLLAEGLKQTILTDNFGDFEFEGLESDRKYQVTFTAEGYKTQTIEAVTRRDVYLGNIFLVRSSARKTKATR